MAIPEHAAYHFVMLLPVRRRPALPDRTETPPKGYAAAFASLLLPGAGQLWQRRYGLAAGQFFTFAACVAAAARFQSGWWIVGGVAINLWSGIEAVWWARGSGEDADPDPQRLPPPPRGFSTD